MNKSKLAFGIIGACLVAAASFAAGKAESRPVETVRIKQNGKVVAEVRLMPGITFTSVVQPAMETATSATTGVVTNVKVRLSFLGGDEIHIKAAEAEIVRQKP